MIAHTFVRCGVAALAASLVAALLAGCTEQEFDMTQANAPAPDPQPAANTSDTQPAPAPAPGPAIQQAMFGAGCFWGVELTFQKTEGVLDTEVGYAGGHLENPTYKQVCYTDTGHAEVVLVTYDPAKVSYGQLLDIFFKAHNPTQLNRQGPDIGSQYRSAIFTYSDEQREAATNAMAALDASGAWSKPIVTQIEDAPTFYAAEDYHQDYLKKKGVDSCSVPH